MFTTRGEVCPVTMVEEKLQLAIEHKLPRAMIPARSRGNISEAVAGRIDIVSIETVADALRSVYPESIGLKLCELDVGFYLGKSTTCGVTKVDGVIWLGLLTIDTAIYPASSELSVSSQVRLSFCLSLRSLCGGSI